jgi:hypothetical protein
MRCETKYHGFVLLPFIICFNEIRIIKTYLNRTLNEPITTPSINFTGAMLVLMAAEKECV